MVLSMFQLEQTLSRSSNSVLFMSVAPICNHDNPPNRLNNFSNQSGPTDPHRVGNGGEPSHGRGGIIIIIIVIIMALCCIGLVRKTI